jgi:hypothetical protein
VPVAARIEPFDLGSQVDCSTTALLAFCFFIRQFKFLAQKSTYFTNFTNFTNCTNFTKDDFVKVSSEKKKIRTKKFSKIFIRIEATGSTSFGRKPFVRQTFGRQIIKRNLLANRTALLANCLLAICLFDKCLSAKFQMSVSQTYVGKFPTGQMFFDQNSCNRGNNYVFIRTKFESISFQFSKNNNKIL